MRVKREYFGDNLYREVPLLATDEARGEHEEHDPKRAAALDAREAALDWREAAGDEGKNDEEARDRKRARDARAIARDRRAHDRRASGARDEEQEPSRREAYERARDSEIDHRRDLDPIAARGARDSRSRIAHDHSALVGVDLRELFSA